jgi:hypothetical protein
VLGGEMADTMQHLRRQQQETVARARIATARARSLRDSARAVRTADPAGLTAVTEVGRGCETLLSKPDLGTNSASLLRSEHDGWNVPRRARPALYPVRGCFR